MCRFRRGYVLCVYPKHVHNNNYYRGMLRTFICHDRTICRYVHR
nr:MAG TPA: hypothetical protein [Caudoviricetes sp.]